jgi:hypothetical protein
MKEEANQRLGTDPVEKSWELFLFYCFKKRKKIIGLSHCMNPLTDESSGLSTSDLKLVNSGTKIMIRFNLKSTKKKYL